MKKYRRSTSTIRPVATLGTLLDMRRIDMVFIAIAVASVFVFPAYAHGEEGTSVCPEATEGTVECLSLVPNGVEPFYEGAGELGGFAPTDLHSAYKLPSTGGSAQTVAIVDAYDDPKAEADLKMYRSHYGLSECTSANGCFKKVNQKGESTNYPSGESGWSLEISLDLDMVSAICAECKILLVEATSNSWENMTAAENEAATLGATEISNSWGGREHSTETSEDVDFNHPGIPIIVSAGDAGYGAEYPASSRYVIAVGGTRLKKATNSRGWSETTWSGTGSGCSAYETKPTWQKDEGCARRTETDLSAVSACESPVSVYDTYEREGWLAVCGTSVAAPIVAGIEALSSSEARSKGPELIWKIGTEGKLFDVSEGSNGSCGTYLCEGKSGYDGPTGWGTPNGSFATVTTPSATTQTVSSVAKTEATLNGSVNPKGSETKYYFEYGTNAVTFEHKTTEASAGSGTTNVNVSKAVSGLEYGTVYYYRLVASNSGGTTYGTPQSFRTLPAYSSSFGSFGSEAGKFLEPSDLVTDASGNVWVADTENSRLEEFNSTGELVRTVGSNGSGNGQFAGVYGVAIDAGGKVWASDTGNDRIEEFSSTGTFEHAYGSAGSGNSQFNVPEGIAINSSGKVFVADRGNHRVEELDAEGKYVKSISRTSEKEGPFGVTIDSSGNLWVSYAWDSQISEFSAEGVLARTWGTKGTAAGQLEDPYRLTVGPEGNVWVAEWGNDRVQVFTPTGEFLSAFGSHGSGEGQFLHARGISIHESNVYVLDSGEFWENTGNSRVEKWLK